MTTNNRKPNARIRLFRARLPFDLPLEHLPRARAYRIARMTWALIAVGLAVAGFVFWVLR